MNWRIKAEGIITDLSMQVYLAANKEHHKRHAPYSIPPVAQSLVECLGNGDEERAKAIFYDLEYLAQVK